MYIVAQVQSPWSKMMGDGDHPQALSRVKAAQGPNQEMAFSLALLDLSQPSLSRKWSDFISPLKTSIYYRLYILPRRTEPDPVLMNHFLKQGVCLTTRYFDSWNPF